MIQKLRRRLTVILTSLTGAILTATLGVSLWFALQQAQVAYIQQLSSDTNYIAVNLPGSEETDRGWMTALETEQNYLLFVNHNSQPMDIEPGWQPKTERAILQQRAIKTIVEEGESFEISGQALPGLLAGTVIIDSAQFAIASREPASDATSLPPAVPESEPDSEPESEDDRGENDDGTVAAEPTQDVRVETGGLDDGNTGTIKNVTPVVEAVPIEDAAAGQASVAIYMSSRASSNVFFEVKGDYGDQYSVTYMDLYVTGHYYELMVVADAGAYIRNVVLLWLGYGGLWLLGMVALVLINRFLAGLVLRPAQNAMQQQADFVAAASHELRSPLAVVRSSLSAADAAPDEETAQKYRGAAEREAKRMSRLVDDLLLLAGGDAGSWKILEETVDVDTLLIELVEQYAPLAKKRRVDLLLDLPEEALGEVKGDKDRLRQIVVALLDNGLRFAPEGTHLALRGRRVKNRIELTVADKGPGIPDAAKHKVFERFYSGDDSRTDKDRFGLGLSVAKELAVLHGGTLSVRDTDGGGATFVLCLPRGD